MADNNRKSIRTGARGGARGTSPRSTGGYLRNSWSPSSASSRFKGVTPRSGASASRTSSGNTYGFQNNNNWGTYGNKNGQSAYGNAYSRSAYGNGAQTATRRARNSYGGRTRSYKPLIVALIVLLAVVAIAAGAVFAYLNSIGNKLNSGVSQDLLNQLQDTTYEGEPFYALLLGADKDEERANSAEFGKSDSAYRTDSMILARIDPKGKKATLISLPRDTMVDMDEYGKQKLNSAYSIGGAAYAVKVVSKLAGVPISHYAECDFDGFSKVVDTLGGVEVDVPMEIDDDEAGGYVAAGYQTLSGEQALIVCRSRHTYDELGAGDLYRAANQRTILSAIAKKALHSNPATILNVISVGAESVTTDISISDMASIANSMRDMNPSTDIYSATMPTTSEYINGIWYEILDQEAWRAMMERVEQGLPPTSSTTIDSSSGIITASNGDGSIASVFGDSASDTSEVDLSRKFTGSVAVRNGTSTEGLAAKVAEVIKKLGFTTDIGNADNSNYASTIIVFKDSSQETGARAIAKALGVGSIMQNDGTYLLSLDYLVVVGSDFK